jgi:hypothetical protein
MELNENNIKVDLTEIICVLCSRFIWLSVVTNGENIHTYQSALGFHKGGKSVDKMGEYQLLKKHLAPHP